MTGRVTALLGSPAAERGDWRRSYAPPAAAFLRQRKLRRPSAANPSRRCSASHATRIRSAVTRARATPDLLPRAVIWRIASLGWPVRRLSTQNAVARGCAPLVPGRRVRWWGSRREACAPDSARPACEYAPSLLREQSSARSHAHTGEFAVSAAPRAKRATFAGEAADRQPVQGHVQRRRSNHDSKFAADTQVSL